MTKRIRIRAVAVEALAELNDTKTAESIWQALPLKSTVQTWGDEIYFSVPLTLAHERPKGIVEVGDLGYWAPGKAFCIFFGPTPASKGKEIRPASPVNIFGKIIGDAIVFKKVRAGSEVAVERGDNAGGV
jgi:hypothetical protein